MPEARATCSTSLLQMMHLSEAWIAGSCFPRTMPQGMQKNWRRRHSYGLSRRCSEALMEASRKSESRKSLRFDRSNVRACFKTYSSRMLPSVRSLFSSSTIKSSSAMANTSLEEKAFASLRTNALKGTSAFPKPQHCACPSSSGFSAPPSAPPAGSGAAPSAAGRRFLAAALGGLRIWRASALALFVVSSVVAVVSILSSTRPFSVSTHFSGSGRFSWSSPSSTPSHISSGGMPRAHFALCLHLSMQEQFLSSSATTLWWSTVLSALAFSVTKAQHLGQKYRVRSCSETTRSFSSAFTSWAGA
mmetsp:Transcript_23652/g.67633  ORF Transcript_23652/g.67633 Transcript_23652/m.67633 type:complete len:303 (+) Transcript_23652:43-951(+)